ncbi:MAG: zinc ribbon domain-containing protein [Calditerrivibrio sp.]|nr:zinc ribbon domain-containing protein [Calditerrivibrio sp.]MCA1981166.1 zinc ribbon domain-containing protein [Calditerrivibrio sp.]
MPIYEFRCNDCGKQFSKLIIRKDDTPECPSCKSQNVEKLISGVATFGKSGSSFGSTGGGCSTGGFR